MTRGKWIEQDFAGVRLLEPIQHADHRGEFVKTFHIDWATEAGLRFELREEFYSVSHRGVLRGMHFQVPPHQHQKIVYCSAGVILDVLVDLRSAEATYGQSLSFELSASNGRVLWIPPGIAHGFLSREDRTCVVYKTDCEYAPESDAGIRWNSFEFNWEQADPILSQRDQVFPSLAEFVTPFRHARL